MLRASFIHSQGILIATDAPRTQLHSGIKQTLTVTAAAATATRNNRSKTRRWRRRRRCARCSMTTSTTNTPQQPPSFVVPMTKINVPVEEKKT